MQLLDSPKLNERHFLKADGVTTHVEIYGQPVNYHRNGKLEWIEAYKLETINGEIRNNCDEFDVRVKGHGLSVKYDGKTTKLKILGLYCDETLVSLPLITEPVHTDTEVIWENIFDGVDIKLVITPTRLQEYVIFNKNPLIGTPFDGKHLYVKYKLTGKRKNKEAYAIDNRNKPVPFIVAEDKKGVEVKALYTYEFPITIEPSVSPNPSSDAFILNDGAPRVRYDTAQIAVNTYSWDSGCGDSGWWSYRGYLRFDLSAYGSETLTNIVFGAYKENAGWQAAWLCTSLGEVEPEAGDITTIWTNAAGTRLGSLSTGIGAKTVSSAGLTSYVGTHKGGYCDFGLTGTEETPYYGDTEQFSSSEATSNKPYLSFDYGSGASTLTISKTDSVAVADAAPTISRSAAPTGPAPSKTESITVTDIPTVSIEAAPPVGLSTSKTDSTVVTDVPTVSVGAAPAGLAISKTESSTATDVPTTSVGAAPASLTINKDDSTAVVDSPIVSIGAAPAGLSVNKSESIAVTDSANGYLYGPWNLVDAIVLQKGAIAAGNVQSSWAYDTDYLILTEETGTPGFTYDFIFNNVRSHEVGETKTLLIKAMYGGNPSHRIKISQYNYTTTQWTNLTVATNDFPYSSVYVNYIFPMFTTTDYINTTTEQTKFRIEHTSPGNPVHLFYIDKFEISEELVIDQSDSIGSEDVPTVLVGAAPGSINIDESESTAISDVPTISIGAAPAGLNVSKIETIETVDVPSLTIGAAPNGLSVSKSESIAAVDVPSININASEIPADLNISKFDSTGASDSVTVTFASQSPPTVVLNIPNTQSFLTNNPTLLFTGTDPNGDEIEYEIQIDYAPTFDSQGGI